jgi:hypothetical protein
MSSDSLCCILSVIPYLQRFVLHSLLRYSKGVWYPFCVLSSIVEWIIDWGRLYFMYHSFVCTYGWIFLQYLIGVESFVCSKKFCQPFIFLLLIIYFVGLGVILHAVWLFSFLLPLYPVYPLIHYGLYLHVLVSRSVLWSLILVCGILNISQP